MSSQPTSKLVQCKSCAHQFRIEYLKRCPNCRAKINSWDFTKSVEVIPEAPQTSNSQTKTSTTATSLKSAPIATIDPLLLQAQRTTHAVRSIAIFILIQMTSSVVAAIFFGIGFAMGKSEGSAMFVLGGLTALIGLFASISAAWREYSESA